MRTVFVNPERCIGCLQCEFACAVEHSQTRDPVAAIAEAPLPRKRIHVMAGPLANSAFPNRCRHCDPAPCQQVCPTGAISRDRTGDLVLLDEARCIACAMCAIVCPFDVLTFHPVDHAARGRVVALKCDGCVDRLERGAMPACVEACKVGALVFGDINEIAAGGRRRETVAVVTATATIPPDRPTVPEGVASWRALGGSAADVGQAGGVR